MKKHLYKLSSVLKIALAVYLLMSLALSFCASYFDQIGEENFLITHRAPFLVVDLSFFKVRGTYNDELQYGYTARGEYVNYKRGSAYTNGDTVLSVDVYNPFCNYFDDIILCRDI